MMGAPEFAAIDRLKGLLEDWARWTEGYRPRLGHHRNAVIKSFGHHDYDYEGQYEANDKETMRAVDTAIDDRPHAQSAAIRRCYTGEDWRFPRENYQDMLDKAHQALLISLPRRNVIL